MERRSIVYEENLGARDPRSEDKDLFKRKVREAFLKKIPVRNCWSCRYHGIGRYEDLIFCRLRKDGVSSNDAADCRSYQPYRNGDEAARAEKANEEYVRKSGRSILDLDKLLSGES